MRALYLLVLLIGFFTAPASAATASDGKPDYRIGERLPQSGPGASPQTSYKEMTWDMLIPEDWDAMREFKRLDFANLRDYDPRALEALDRLREAWRSAPVQPSLKGARIRIAGFMVPLERQGKEIREFLLVPYFGACIHVPPPPANQIIHVILPKPIKDARIMEAFWVSGTLEFVYSDFPPWGASGYRMKAEVITPYTKP